MNSFHAKSKRAGTNVEGCMRLLVVVLGMLLLCLPAFSQGNFGRILGAVTDQTGGTISGATVTIIDTQRGVAATLTTDNAGEFNAPTLIPSTYTVRVEAKGFKKLERQNLVLEVGKEVRVDLTVQPGEQTQTVTVTEAVPLVDTASATLGGTLNNADISDLPLNGRDYQKLLGLRPGVMLQPGGSPWTQSTNNIRPDETAWMVEGVFNANFADNRSVANMASPITDEATILPVDAIQEFNLEENPKAEYGWKPGAIVNVGIRSGTNQFHGAAYAFGRDGSWDARSVYNAVGTPQTDVALKQFGAVLGGPVKRDKLFFFAGYEGLRSIVGNSLAGSVPELAAQPTPDPANSMPDAIAGVQAAGLPLSPVSLQLLGCTVGPPITCTGGYILGAHANTTSYVSTWPNQNTSDNGVAKVDYRINNSNMINGSLVTGKYIAIGEDFAMVNPIWRDTFPQRTWTAVGNWIWTVNSNLVNVFRVGYNRASSAFIPADSNKFANGKDYPLNTGITSNGGFPTITIAGFTTDGVQLGSRRGRPMTFGPSPYYDFQDSISYLRGKHALKFGVEIAHIEADINADDTRGQIDFRPGAAAAPTLTPLEDFFAGIPGRASVLVGNPALAVTFMNDAGFVQDDWRIAPKVMLNLGLRYSYVSPFKAANNALGNFVPSVGLVQQGQTSVGSTIWKPDYHDFSPRLGIAWDVKGDGKTVVRAGASLMYSMFALATFTGNPGISDVPGGTSLAGIPTGACTTSPPVGSPCPQTFGGTITTGKATLPGSAVNWNGVAFPQGAVFSCTAAKPCSISSVDPNLKTPYVGNWNLGIQHVLSPNLSLEVGYVGNHGDNLTGFRDINQCAVPNTGACVNPFGSQYAYLGFINEMSNYARSNYNSLQATLTERVTHGLSFIAGYTYGHGLDNGSLNRFAPQAMDTNNTARDYSNSDFDVRHRLTFTASYALPGKKGYGQLLEGWKMNTILNIQSSQPWNVLDSSNNFSGSGDSNDRWDFFGSSSNFRVSESSIPFCSFSGPASTATLVGCTTTNNSTGVTTALPASLAQQCLAVAPDLNTLGAGGCFVDGKSVMVPPVAGTFGTMGRNLFRDRGFQNMDFSIFKGFKFTERFGAEFRAEFFNVFNHPTLSNPWGSVNGYQGGSDPSSPGTFGCGCATPDSAAGNPILGSGDARQIQLGLKLMF